MNSGIVESNNSVLVIKLSPINGVNSSMMRTLALIKGLQENGYSVDMVTIKESTTHVTSDISKYEFLRKVNIIYANGNAAYNKIVSGSGGVKKIIVSVLRKLHHMFSVYDFTNTIAKQIKIDILGKNEYRYIISVSDPKPAHIAMRNLISQGLKYQKWVQYWGDPLALDITNDSIYPKGIYKILEKKLFDNADKIVYTSPFTVEEQTKMYPAFASRMRFVPTAYINEKIISPHDGKYTIGYYGAYTSSVRNIMPLYDACSEIEDVELIIVGNSDLDLNNKENISIYPRGDVEAFEKKTDLFVCILNSSGTQIPGKVYHYAATNRPVLIVLDGERKEDMREFFEKFGRYHICYNSVESIISSISEIRKNDGKCEPLKQFSCRSVSHLIID